MHRRHNAQRQHIVHSLDTILYQLHIVSFFLSPSLWALLCRLFAQFMLSKPRDFDSSRSLRFWFCFVLFFNIGSVWSHATQGTAEGRAIILDFLGLAHTPSKTHLLLLDLLIITLQWLLATVAYESSLALSTPTDITTVIQAHLLSPLSQPATPSLEESSSKPPPPDNDDSDIYIIDLRFAALLRLLRDPPQPSPELALPLPNTTTWPLPSSLRLLMRANAEMRRRAQMGEETTRRDVNAPGTIPGSMDASEGG